MPIAGATCQQSEELQYLGYSTGTLRAGEHHVMTHERFEDIGATDSWKCREADAPPES